MRTQPSCHRDPRRPTYLSATVKAQVTASGDV